MIIAIDCHTKYNLLCSENKKKKSNLFVHIKWIITFTEKLTFVN